MEISIIVPVYNGEKTIAELCRRIRQALEGLFIYEIILVHDRGKDNSWEVIQAIAAENQGVIKGFSLDRNYGQHNAILFGIGKASGKFIVTIDEDLQHDPAIIHDLMQKQIEADYDVVYARFERLRHPDFRIRTSELLRRILRIIIPGLYPGYSPYRLIKRDVAVKMLGMKSSYAFIDGYLGRLTGSFGYINAEHFSRADGESSYSYYMLFRHALRITIAHSSLRKMLIFKDAFHRYAKKKNHLPVALTET